ncbi:MAG: SapC family protein [Sinobacteraceae bacterium]|nr:SapC family protein [Nevskiaceae bacterium]
MRLVELSREEHSGLRIRADLVEAAAADQHLIPIVVSEFRRAAIEYPIVFAKHPETGRFAPYVLNGLGVKENLFWSGTELDVAYVPLNVRRQPFYVGTANALCIDLDNPSVEPSGKKTLINPDGSDSAYLEEMLSILGELVTGQGQTERFIANVLSLELLAPIVLNIVLDDETPLQLEGLYGIDEEKFRQLDERETARLRRTGHLDLIYSVLIASGQIFKLIRLKNQRLALSRAWHSNAS